MRAEPPTRSGPRRRFSSGQDGVDAALDRLAEAATGLRVELQELAGELRGYAEGIEAEPGRLEQVEERLEAVDRLKRKHGGIDRVGPGPRRTLPRRRSRRSRARARRPSRLEAELAKALRARTDLAAQLSEVRAKAARRLEERVADELEQLAMSGARLEVSLEPHPDGFGPLGQERVTLLVATNPGMPVSPLRDAASGGELSRLMLALAGQGARGGAATYVFDEIDAGVGGNTARAVGERLRALGERAPGSLHHPPAAGRLDGAVTFPDREGRRGRPGDGEGRARRRGRAGRRDRPDAGRRRRR